MTANWSICRVCSSQHKMSTHTQSTIEKSRWKRDGGRQKKRRKRKIEREWKKKRTNCRQFPSEMQLNFINTRACLKKKTNLLWCYRYVADRDAWVERIERGRERERRRGVCPSRHMSHGSTEGMIHGQGTLAHAPNFASHTGRQAHHLTY